ncbi:MarR family winged helix-turn-helix transcriptional regulator [Speluncibacter jeojiensis]
MVVPLGRALTEAELPILQAHGLTMWAYVVLSALREQPVRTQSALAATIGADKTRIIKVLDDLEARGLLERRPDPEDRRARLLSLTPEGRSLHADAQREIQRGERLLLDRLSEEDRRGFLRALQILSRPTDLSE